MLSKNSQKAKNSLKMQGVYFLDKIMREKKATSNVRSFFVFLCLRVSMSEEQDKNILEKF